ncbi:glycosyltransferase family 2 protein [Halosimplex aquaticum]
MDAEKSALVSVVVPYSASHTPESMLQEALQSVDQQEISTECIVVRDPEQHGPAWARNRGIERSETRYVAFLDADDLWTANKLNRQIEHMATTGAGLCVEGNDMPTEVFLRRIFLGKMESLTSSILIDLNRVDTRFEESLNRFEDHLFMLEAVAESSVCLCKDITEIRKQDQGLSHRTSPEQLFEERERYGELALERVPSLRQYEPKFKAKLSYDCGRHHHFRGQYRKAVSCFRRSLTFHPRFKPIAALFLSLLRLCVPTELFSKGVE